MPINEDWDLNLKLNRKAIKRSREFSPMLFLRKDSGTTSIAICGTKNGNALRRVIRNILREQKPDYYILAFLGWNTEFGDKLEGGYPEYKHVVDMPLDDRVEVYIQLMVNKEYGLIKSYMAEVDSRGGFTKPEEGGFESKFVVSWK